MISTVVKKRQFSVVERGSFLVVSTVAKKGQF